MFMKEKRNVGVLGRRAHGQLFRVGQISNSRFSFLHDDDRRRKLSPQTTMTYLPSYYHLSQSQINQLSFHVNIRCVRTGDTDTITSNDINVSNDDNDASTLISRDIAWQEKITRTSDDIDDGDYEKQQGGV